MRGTGYFISRASSWRAVCASVALVASLGLAGCGSPSPSSTSAPISMSAPTAGGAPDGSPSATQTAEPPVAAVSKSLHGRPATVLVVLRPVHHGRPANGFVATPQPGHRLDACYGGSRGAVNQGIYDCSTTTDYEVACWWASQRATMYCLHNPFSKQLAQLPLKNPSLPGAPAPAVASALGLVLDDGARCWIREDGSSPSLPAYPDWIGTYSCNTQKDQIVWASDGDGVNRANRTWTVMTTGGSTVPVIHAVTVAYFAGN